MSSEVKIAEFESRINAATNSGANAREKTLDKLTNEAKKQLKEVQRLDKALQMKQDKLEKIVYNIENIDEYMKELTSKNKPQTKGKAAQSHKENEDKE